jgi:choline dehydrogenase-like flavoprotein
MTRAFKDVSGNVKVDADAVVVGTGAGGAAAAHRLQKAGKSVVLIEEGSYVQPEEFSTDSLTAMRQLYRDNGIRSMVGTMIIPTMQARCVGGTTVINSAICFRLPDDVLDEWVEEEKLEGLTPEGLKPLFDEVYDFTSISAEPDDVQGMHNLLMRKGCENIGWKGEPIERNSRGCVGCGTCMSGCVEGAKMSTDRCYVPAFLELGGELYTDCRIEKIMVENKKAVGVKGTFIEPGSLKPSEKTLEVRAKAVVIACGAIGTPVLLKKNGLANSSGLVGRNLCNHIATGMIGVFEEDVYSWKGPQEGYTCVEFRKDGFMIEVAWAPPDVIGGIRLPGFGIRHKDLMARLKHMLLWGAMIRAKTTGRVIAPKKGWSPTILYNTSKRDGRLMQVAMKAVADLHFAAGAEFILPGVYKVPSEIHDPKKTQAIMDANLGPTDFSPIGNHPNGTCRMSEDKKRGVVNSYGETHDVKNLYIADASIFPNSPGVNPQVTIMALALHVADHIKEVI